MAESHDSSAHLPPPSFSNNQLGGWRAVKYILANETFEKLAAMSLIANLVVYLHTQYNLDNTHSAEVFSIWSGFSNFLPLLGAYLADAYLGKYHMLFFGLISSFLGMALVSLGAGLPSLRPPACTNPAECIQPTGLQLSVLFIGLGLLAVGSGGLRPCNIAFGADQFDVSTEKGRSQLESFCNWWYLLFTLALIVALTLVVYIQTNISWFLGFAIPTACFSLSTLLFLLGRNTYIRLKPKGSVIFDLVKVMVAASRKRHVNMGTDYELSYHDPPPSDPKMTVVRTDRFPCLDKASVIVDANELNDEGEPRDGWRLCSVKQVEELKAILRTIPVWIAGIFCFLAMTQTGSFGILQAIQMHTSLGKNHHFTIPPAWLGLVPMISLSIWIYIYEKIFIPWAQKAFPGGRRLSIEHRILIGIIFSILCMVVSGSVEVKRRESALEHGSFESPISMWMLVPQFALSGLTEAFAAIAMMELLTTYWPENMKAIGGAVFFLSLSIANYMTTILIEVIKRTTSLEGTAWLGGNDLNKNRLEYYYYTIGVIGVVNLFYYILFARHFLYSKVIPVRRSVAEQLDGEEKGTRS